MGRPLDHPFRCGLETCIFAGDRANVGPVDADVVELAAGQLHQLSAGLPVLSPRAVPVHYRVGHGRGPFCNRGNAFSCFRDANLGGRPRPEQWNFCGSALRNLGASQHNFAVYDALHQLM